MNRSSEDYAGRDDLFTEDYAYFSSYSSSWIAHAESYVNEVTRRFDLAKKNRSTVVEVAANDGYLLQYVQRKGIDCYGIEPTRSTAAAAREKGIEIVEEFFGDNLAMKLKGKRRQADLMIANNVLAHVPKINDFVKGFARLLKPDGVATFEFPHLLQMVNYNQFDTAYHEHFSYLSFITTKKIFAKCGLNIFDVQEISTHGGSLRVFAQRSDTGEFNPTFAVNELIEKERMACVNTDQFYLEFQIKAEKIKNDLLLHLIDFKNRGLKVCGYGAAAKGNTLINFAGIRSDLLAFVADRNPNKQGKFLPGSRIPIRDENHLIEMKPDYIFLLPWNLKTEITEQLAYIQKWGGKFLIAVPCLEVF